MKNAHRRMLAATVTGLAASLLVTGCSIAGTGASGPATSQPTGASTTVAPPSASPGADAGAVAAACTVVTEEDASAALGLDPGPGIGVTVTRGTTCTYGAAPTMVSVHVNQAGKAEYDQMHAKAVDGVIELNGIGEAAIGTFHPPVAAIMFYQGTSFVSIVIYGDDSPERAVTLATAAAGRL